MKQSNIVNLVILDHLENYESYLKDKILERNNPYDSLLLSELLAAKEEFIKELFGRRRLCK